MTIKEIQRMISDENIMEQLALMRKVRECIDSHSYTVYEERAAEKELKEMAKEIILNLK